MNTLRTLGPVLLSDMASALGVIAGVAPTLAVAQLQLASTGIERPVTSAWISIPDRQRTADLAHALLLGQCTGAAEQQYWAGAPTAALEALGSRIDLEAASLWVELVTEALPHPVAPTITLQELCDLLDLVSAAAMTAIPVQVIHVRPAAGEIEIHAVTDNDARVLAAELAGLDLHLRPIVRALTTH